MQATRCSVYSLRRISLAASTSMSPSPAFNSSPQGQKFSQIGTADTLSFLRVPSRFKKTLSSRLDEHVVEIGHGPAPSKAHAFGTSCIEEAVQFCSRNTLSFACCQRPEELAPSPHPRSCRGSVRSRPSRRRHQVLPSLPSPRPAKRGTTAMHKTNKTKFKLCELEPQWRGGLPLVVSADRNGVHSMSVTASADQLLSSVNLRTTRVRNTNAICCTSTLRDAAPMPTMVSSEETLIQPSRAHVPSTRAPFSAPVARCVQRLHWTRATPRRNLAYNLFCPSIRNDFVSDRRNESENGAFTANGRAHRSTTQKLPLTKYASFGPFTVHSVAKTFVEERHVAKRATTDSSPTSVRDP